MISGGHPPRPRRAAQVHGIFNVRAAVGLQNVADISLIWIRAWLPGRALCADFAVDGVPGISISAPLIGVRRWDLESFRRFAWRRVKPVLEQADLVHSVGASFAGVLSSYWAAQANIGHVTQVTGSDVNEELPEMLRSRSARNWERHLQGVACNSEALKTAFLKIYPDVANVRAVYRGTNLNVFAPSSTPLGSRAEENGVRFLFLGGFPPYRFGHGRNTKGGVTLLEAWKAVEGELFALGAALWIGGPDSCSHSVASWQQSLRHPNSVRFLGEVSPGHVPHLMSSIDAVLVPSLSEGLPNVAVEASACGRLVVAARVGGLPEVIEDGKSGFLIPPGDPTALSDILLSTAKDRALALHMGQYGRQRMETLFDSRDYPLNMLALYEAALSSCGTRATLSPTA